MTNHLVAIRTKGNLVAGLGSFKQMPVQPFPSCMKETQDTAKHARPDSTIGEPVLARVPVFQVAPAQMWGCICNTVLKQFVIVLGPHYTECTVQGA